MRRIYFGWSRERKIGCYKLHFQEFRLSIVKTADRKEEKINNSPHTQCEM